MLVYIQSISLNRIFFFKINNLKTFRPCRLKIRVEQTIFVVVISANVTKPNPKNKINLIFLIRECFF